MGRQARRGLHFELFVLFLQLSDLFISSCLHVRQLLLSGLPLRLPLRLLLGQLLFGGLEFLLDHSQDESLKATRLIQTHPLILLPLLGYEDIHWIQSLHESPINHSLRLWIPFRHLNLRK